MIKSAVTLLILVLSINSNLYSSEKSESEGNLDSLKTYQTKELEVTAVKDASDILTMASSANVIEGLDINGGKITSLNEFTGSIPNLFMPDYGSKLTSPVYIRGIGSRIKSPSVGLYVDNVPYFEKASFDFDFFDIKRVEVLRGPQGTLYGRNTMGGIINVFTKSPLNTQETSIKAGAGSYQRYNAGLSHYNSIGENFGYSVNLNYLNEGGYFENSYRNERADDLESIGGRTNLIYKVNENLSFENIINYEKSKQNAYPYAKYDLETRQISDINYNQKSYYNRDMFSDGLVTKYKTDEFEITAMTSYQYLKDENGIDQDFSSDSLFYVLQDQAQDMFSQEIVVKSPGKQKYDWLLGLWGFHQSFTNTVDVDIYGPQMKKLKEYDHNINGYAVFHQSTLNDLLTDGLSLSVGLRGDYETDQLNYYYKNTVKGNSSVVADTTYPELNTFEVLPKFSLMYSLASNMNIYSTVARGYKTGGFNSTFERPRDLTYKPEYNWNYEFGAKTELFGNRVYADFALFYIDWTDQQIYQPVPSGRGSMLKNAGKSTSKGVEFSLQAEPFKRLQTNFSFGYTDAKFDNYRVDSTTDFSGNYIPYVPKFNASFRAIKTIELGSSFFYALRVSGKYNLLGKLYWNEENTAYQDTYGIMDLSVTLLTKRFDVDIWAKNVLNQDYQAFYFEAFNSSFAQKGKPVRFGANISVNL